MKSPRTLCTLVLLLFMLASGGLSAQSSIRLANVISEPVSLDAYIDSTAPPAITGVQHAYAGARAPLAPGQHHVTIVTNGAPVTGGIYDLLLTASQDSNYAVVLTSTPALDHVVLASAKPGTIPQDSTLVRFVNISPSLGGDLEISATPGGGAPSFKETSLPFKGVSAYRMVPASDLTVRTGPPGQPPVYKALGYLPGGSMVTVIVAGDFGPSSIYTLVESDTNAQTPMPQFSLLPVEQGAFRAVHVAAGLPAVDLFMDGVAADSLSLRYRFASSIREDLVGAHTVKVGPGGSGLANASLEIPLTIPADTLTTLYIIGPPNALNSAVLRSSAADEPNPGHAMLRVLHAAPELPALDFRVTFAGDAVHNITALPFKSATPFMEGASGAMRIDFMTSGSSVPVLSVGGFLNQGVVATAIINGSAADQSLAVNLLLESDPEEQEPMTLLSLIASVEGGSAPRLPAAIISPNPAQGLVRISYTVPSAGAVRVSLYDMLGRQAALVADAPHEAGEHVVPFSTEGIQAGPYTVMVSDEEGRIIATGRLLVVR